MLKKEGYVGINYVKFTDALKKHDKKKPFQVVHVYSKIPYFFREDTTENLVKMEAHEVIAMVNDKIGYSSCRDFEDAHVVIIPDRMKAKGNIPKAWRNHIQKTKRQYHFKSLTEFMYAENDWPKYRPPLDAQSQIYKNTKLQKMAQINFLRFYDPKNMSVTMVAAASSKSHGKKKKNRTKKKKRTTNKHAY